MSRSSVKLSARILLTPRRTNKALLPVGLSAAILVDAWGTRAWSFVTDATNLPYLSFSVSQGKSDTLLTCKIFTTLSTKKSNSKYTMFVLVGGTQSLLVHLSHVINSPRQPPLAHPATNNASPSRTPSLLHGLHRLWPTTLRLARRSVAHTRQMGGARLNVRHLHPTIAGTTQSTLRPSKTKTRLVAACVRRSLLLLLLR